MPELPEIETVVGDLKKKIIGKTLTGVRVFCPKLIKGPLSEFKRLSNAKIISILRRGKYIIINLSGGQSLLIHLKLTGQLVLVEKKSPVEKHTHLIFGLKGKSQELRYLDVRKFGRLKILPTQTLPQELSYLGPEPLSLSFFGFWERITRAQGKIKPLLLNQEFMAGIGNIYADEILFRAGLRPQRKVESLKDKELKKLFLAIKAILKKAIKYRGTTIRDYRDGFGESGDFQKILRVYGRGGEKCLRCGHPISRITMGGRGTHFCAYCQK